ncbi:MAG: glutamate synthase large subunit [Balneolales bacterium]
MIPDGYNDEKSACGVGFIASRKNEYSHKNLQDALHALCCVEHRGACSADQVTGDGAGIMTDIPFELFGYEKGEVAVATLFTPIETERQRIALKVFEETFAYLGMKVVKYRDVPIQKSILGKDALETLPRILHAFIERPKHCRTKESFEKLLYAAKQLTRTKERESGIVKEFFFTSLSTSTIVYKALTRADALQSFYLDLQNPQFKTRFSLFHRRFSTNTKTSWDKAQPFRLIGHNGEINTITSNRSWAYSREKSLGLPTDELLTDANISDSGSFNEMAEALMYRSSIPHLEDILAIMIPPADQKNSFYRFWRRAMEPWDGPAFITYANGTSLGARLDRNGFRPCRWSMTDDHLYLSSEAGSFEVDESKIIKKGSLQAGGGIKIDLDDGEIHFRDPSQSRENHDAEFDPRLVPLEEAELNDKDISKASKTLHNYTKEDLEKYLIPMITEAKEPIGSMGDTARPAIFSDQPRSFFDYFYQNFAQVTNPPLDYLREKMVTDLSTYLGRRPNIFAPKELIPPTTGYDLKSPVISLGQMKTLREQKGAQKNGSRFKTAEFNMQFERSHGTIGFKSAIKRITEQVIEAVNHKAALIILTDRNSSYNQPPIPSLIMLRAVVNALNDDGLRLKTSILVDTAEVRTTHQLAALVGFGATAVCPYLALEVARFEENRRLKELKPDLKEKNYINALESGLLKIMSKSGISVVKSYQSSKLFMAVGIGDDIARDFFPGLYSPISGIGLDELVEQILHNTERANEAEEDEKLIHTYQFKEHNRGKKGEKHSMTNSRSKVVHDLVRENHAKDKAAELYNEYLKFGQIDDPVNIRHLFKLKRSENPIDIDKVETRKAIQVKFGSGAMSFGAISAESQRDIFLAMKEIGGRSNSGEGGENPYYFKNGVTAAIKQVASARFGVTAEYIVSGEGVQIKIAQGAKPGEGGQLMGIKVNEDIARARHANPGFDLISPPPLHDIYSIEDLKQLIYELKQLKPSLNINVKLVAGANIGTIAVGVAKAGADVIHISGGDGGTGAATLSSMKHAGLPWEFGLTEVHEALSINGLRENVKLRVDGGLSTGKDLAIAAILGGEEFEFGKLLLVAQGCVMARVCEKNTCPTGIATHDPKFKAKYQGEKDHVIKMMNYLADDLRQTLAQLGVSSVDQLIGRKDLLEVNENHAQLIDRKKIDLGFFLNESHTGRNTKDNLFFEGINDLNSKILSDCKKVLDDEGSIELSYKIKTTDRAALSTLSGEIASRIHSKRKRALISKNGNGEDFRFGGNISIKFDGSAGQGFGVFMVEGLDIELRGEANDSVCKTMSGGQMVIRPKEMATFDPAKNAIIGNCAMYGATEGILYVYGRAGDRFAVRNSGATAVVEGTGLHACEYMTNGIVLILGEVSHNVGAGMTGGQLYLRKDQLSHVNDEYITKVDMVDSDYDELKALMTDYHKKTGSNTAAASLEDWDTTKQLYIKLLPIGVVAKMIIDEQESSEAAA